MLSLLCWRYAVAVMLVALQRHVGPRLLMYAVAWYEALVLEMILNECCECDAVSEAVRAAI